MHNMDIEKENLVSNEESSNPQMDVEDPTSITSAKNLSKSAPFALHLRNKENETDAPNGHAPSSNVQKPHQLRAPYAQPVLDASKLNPSTSKRSSVDERIALVRERRLLHQQALGNPIVPEQSVIEQEFQQRRAKDDAAYAKWEQAQEDRKKKMEENREKEEKRRKEVEMRKQQHLDEEKKRAEAIVARTEQQASVVLRQKRTTSIDRKKRWSWGAGGYGGGGSGGITYATSVETAPAPFHYFDSTRMTKHRRSSGLSTARRPLSMTASNLDLSQFTYGDDDMQSGCAGSGSFGYGSPTNAANMQRDDKFSKSPLLMGTSHMAFASGLRSYDSSPVSSTSKHSSPATTSRAGRARSSDTRIKAKGTNSPIANNGPTNKTATRGRSPAARRTESLKRPKATTSTQLTEPSQLSSRLLAPTKASIARSKQTENQPDGNAPPPVRSRSNDRRHTKDRPSSARSDTSSSSSSTLSPRAPITTTPTSRAAGRTPSPSLYKPRSQKSSSLQSSSSPNLSQRQRGQSPQLRTGQRRAPSPVVKGKEVQANKESKPPSRGTSPSRQQSPSTSRPATGSKRTPVRDAKSQLNKSTPPTIKQPLKQGISLGKKSAASPTLLSKSKLKESKERKTVAIKSPEPSLDVTTKEKQSSDKDKDEVTIPAVSAKVELEPGDQPETKSYHEKAIPQAEQDKVVANEDVGKDTAGVNDSASSESASTLESIVVTEEIKKVVEEVKEEVLHVTVTQEDDITSGKENDLKLVEKIEDINEEGQFGNQDASDAMANNNVLTNNEQRSLETDQENVQQSSASGNVQADSSENGISADEQSATADGVAEEPANPLELIPDENPKAPVSADVHEQSVSDMCAPESEENTLGDVNIIEKSEIEESEKLTEETAPEHRDVVLDKKDSKPEQESVTDSVDVPAVVDDHEETQPPVEQQPIAEKVKVEVAEKTPESEVAQEKPAPQAEVGPAAKPDPTPAPESKKKEKKLTPEEQAYKEAMAAKRREAKEKREREEQERQERKRLAAEESARRVEIARRMAEEAKLEEERRLEEERKLQEEEEAKKKQEAEELARKHEEFIKEQKERVEQRAKEEAEKVRKERNLAAQKKEEERLQRKKRLEMIMRRTRGGDSPTPSGDTSPSHNAPSGESSPSNVTPTGGSSPYNSVTPDRTVSPATVETVTLPSDSESTSNSKPSIESPASEADAVSASDDHSQAPVPSDEGETVPTLILPEDEGSAKPAEMPEPLLAFVPNVNGTAEGDAFVSVKDQNGRTFDNDAASDDHKVAVKGSNGFASEESFAEQQYAKMQEVPTGNLLEF